MIARTPSSFSITVLNYRTVPWTRDGYWTYVRILTRRPPPMLTETQAWFVVLDLDLTYNAKRFESLHTRKTRSRPRLFTSDIRISAHVQTFNHLHICFKNCEHQTSISSGSYNVSSQQGLRAWLEREKSMIMSMETPPSEMMHYVETCDMLFDRQVSWIKGCFRNLVVALAFHFSHSILMIGKLSLWRRVFLLAVLFKLIIWNLSLYSSNIRIFVHSDLSRKDYHIWL